MRLVLIEWLDSFGASSEWGIIDNPKPKPLTCRSVGWLVYDGSDCKMVVPHLSSDHESCKQQGCGDMTIPAASILHITDLKTLPI